MTISFSERQPTALQQLSRSLGQGIGGGLQARNALNLENEKMSIADRLKTAQKQSELAQKQERFGEFSKTKEFKALDPLTQQVVEGEFLGIIPAGTGKSIIEIQQRQKEQDLLNSLLGGGQVNAQHQPLENAHENPLQQNAPSPNAPPTPNVPTESQLEQLTDNQLDQLIGMGGKIADVAKGVQTRKAEEKKSAERTKLALNKETLPVRKEISDRAENARRSIAQKENLIKTIDTGKIDDPTFAIVMESLPLNFGKRFLSPETVEYKSGLVQGYGDLKNIFTGATRVKEVEILENKIADLYLTDQQKKAILKSTMDINKLDLINEEVQ